MSRNTIEECVEDVMAHFDAISSLLNWAFKGIGFRFKKGTEYVKK